MASNAPLTRHVCQEGTDVALGKMGRDPAHVAVYWDYRSEVRNCSSAEAQLVHETARSDALKTDG